MSMTEEQVSLENFRGTARLFPLPNLVLFPSVIQPLHIFEPRYRQMTTDALAGDRLIAMVLLQPGWEANYDGQPPIHPVACLGKIVAEQRLDDGRYNLLLRGLGRVRLVQELPQEKLYRSAAAEVLTEQSLADQTLAKVLQQQVMDLVAPWFEAQAEAREQLQRLLDNQPELGVLCDVLAFALPLTPAQKQELLEEADVARRALRLVKQLQQQNQPEATRKFPPDFSAN